MERDGQSFWEILRNSKVLKRNYLSNPVDSSSSFSESISTSLRWAGTAIIHNRNFQGSSVGSYLNNRSIMFTNDVCYSQKLSERIQRNKNATRGIETLVIRRRLQFIKYILNLFIFRSLMNWRQYAQLVIARGLHNILSIQKRGKRFSFGYWGRWTCKLEHRGILACCFSFLV